MLDNNVTKQPLIEEVSPKIKEAEQDNANVVGRPPHWSPMSQVRKRVLVQGLKCIRLGS